MLARIFFSAFGTFTVYNDSRAATVRTEDPIFQTVGVIIIHRFRGLGNQGRTAFHTEMARERYDRIAFGTGLTGDLFITMRAFHNDSQLFEEVTV